MKLTLDLDDANDYVVVRSVARMFRTDEKLARDAKDTETADELKDLAKRMDKIASRYYVAHHGR